MISKLLSPGDKISLRAVGRLRKDDNAEHKEYNSQIYDILSEDSLEITMPMEKTKLILLAVDSEYEFSFFCESGSYQCMGRIIDRYKTKNVYLLAVELTSNLRKFQRREYYRFSCALEMCSRSLIEDEIKAIEAKGENYLASELPLKRSIIVDISGGGLRFIADQQYEKDNLVYCNYYLVVDGENKEYSIVGKVLSSRPVENRPGLFEHRVKYVDIDIEKREEIIRFIFQEERKNRKKENGL